MFKWLGKIFSSGGDAKTETDAQPKRARVKGRYKADDKSTPDVNEAFVQEEEPPAKKTGGKK